MLFRNRFLLLLALAALLALLSLSLQFFHLIPVSVAKNGVSSKSRKRIMPDPVTEPPGMDPLYEALLYCNIPSVAERSMEGHAPHHFKLVSVHVFIRHGDRYPLYVIPKTKRPEIDCTLVANRKPYHPKLEAFVSHMSKGSGASFESPLHSLPLFPNHPLCEMGELTQTGVVQHLQNGQLLRDIYLKKHQLLPSDWSPDQLYLETTGKSRTLQSGLALLYGFLPDFDWKKVYFRHQPSALFCSGSCYCPMRNHYLEKEQRRQYLLRLKNGQLERAYGEMAKVVDIPTKQLRAANPIDSLLCHFCHNLSFPCTGNGCIDMEHFKAIKTHQMEDERERREKKLYLGYALLGAHPILNQTVGRMLRAAEGRSEEVFALYSAHDVTLSPVLSALGLTEARFPRFAARLIFELWQDRDEPREHAVRVLYNGVDVTFHTSFCQDHRRRWPKPMCPLDNLVRFVRRDMLVALGSGSTNYYDACHRKGF
ncbi:2-phosphoxylose phosphatase 1 isoform X1 [Myotis myotis]|uniref:2-phosphoxylose phosphatase 1 n=2 Tax=Myotis myotis TaxID=51298 RepID=A0A7J7UDW0_MYOMY|nr:2-phosphoxylose phosphatase 1 isoform X1 [Myotis myotis]XP_036188277.1 2-phosphoxylose phosphatase 1 isoform X1 [Myotis myotis]XP_036188278.1 2-phosphoxylose phosphatase 1 isoform X1 [Myotis myotis]XP_036188279.1 2-phosphoxylose phosphatase 1 isoform X1 [Myotis myotis]XP_036188281.1 2-phosphoxylose phosphatase 1 isoform X1 [Myotis myotis]KAF6311055.1 2-phosphoxylose phosphatase 1 [Myotis myotis]